MNNWKEDYIKLVCAAKEAEALALKKSQLPILYRYMSLTDYALETIEKLAVYMSSASVKNDPLEIPLSMNDDRFSLHFFKQSNFGQNFFDQYGKIITREEIDSIIYAPDPQDRFEQICLQKGIDRDFTQGASTRKQVFESFHDRQRNQVRICSFSEVNTDMSMWSNYADQHKGICVAYQFAEAEKILPFLEPVVYQERKIELSDFLGKPNSHTGIFIAAITKGNDYSHEKEWRIVFPHKEDGYYKVTAPQAIYLGLRFSQNDPAQQQRLALLAGQQQIPLQQMTEQHGAIGVVNKF